MVDFMAVQAISCTVVYTGIPCVPINGTVVQIRDIFKAVVFKNRHYTLFSRVKKCRYFTADVLRINIFYGIYDIIDEIRIRQYITSSRGNLSTVLRAFYIG